MKLKNILYYLAVIVLLTSQLWAQNTNPVVTNVEFSISGTTVTVTYDVADLEQTTVTISMQVSSDGGATWSYNYGSATGDIGAVSGVSSVAAHKTITWQYSSVENSNFKIMIAADDGQIGGSDCGTVVYGSQTYHTILVGNQCWLKENLNVGTKITGVTDQTDNSIIEKYCYADQDTSCTKYGGLYQWAEAVQYQNGATNTTAPNPDFSGNVQGICPTGWHIPTQAELQTLATAISNNYNSLEAIGQGSGSGAGSNTSGFSAMLGGFRHIYNSYTFFNFGSYTMFWSTTDYYSSSAYFLRLVGTDNVNSNFYANAKTDGYSVRCLKDL